MLENIAGALVLLIESIGRWCKLGTMLDACGGHLYAK